ncbi:16970_t:CDS:2, partial [Racocetra persica]
QVVTDLEEDNVPPTPLFEKLKNASKKQTDLFGYFGNQDSQNLFERFMEIKKVLALR